MYGIGRGYIISHGKNVFIFKLPNRYTRSGSRRHVVPRCVIADDANGTPSRLSASSDVMNRVS